MAYDITVNVQIYECNKLKVSIGQKEYWYSGITEEAYEMFKQIRERSHGKAIHFLKQNATRCQRIQAVDGAFELVDCD